MASIVTMYIRKTVRRYKDKIYVNFLLVESVLTDKGPRQKVICSLGDLSPAPPQQWLAWPESSRTPSPVNCPFREWPMKTRNSSNSSRLPVQAVPPADVDTTASTTPSADDLVAVHLDRVTYESPRPAGHVHVGRLRKLG